ncbi:MAG: ribonuclease P protein component [Fluviicola sp.]|jgi:ribonuclease P protein component|nr:ribonuclease P protein component [Fluviicola sp.]
MSQSFGKEYKLCRRKLIDGVFKTGKVVKQYPFVVHFLEVDEKLDAPFQITISAPKRNFRKAHDRNRIKRLMRETIRFNKMILEDKISKSQKNIIMFMVYTSKEEIPFTTLMKKNELLFEQITKHIE